MKTVIDHPLAHQIEPNALARFVRFGSAQLEMMKTLRAAVVWDRMATLIHARRELAAGCEAVAARSGFFDAYDTLRAGAPGIQQQIGAAPVFGIWCETLCQLLARQAHHRYPEYHLASHLADFGRFALAAALIEKRNAQALVRLNSDGCLTLPGVGLVAEFQPDLACQRFLAKSQSGDLIFDQVNATPRLRRLSLTGAGLTLDDGELSFRCHGGGFEFTALTNETTGDWLIELNAAFETLAAIDSAMAAEIAATIRVIVPLEAKHLDVHESSSLPQAFGAVYLSRANHPNVVAEAFVHEYLHNRLNALMRLDQLVAGPTQEAVYYSPWKAAPRPLRGILHGIVAFLGIVCFWRQAVSRGGVAEVDWAVRRCALLEAQLKVALEALERSAAFTPIGEALFAGLQAEMAEIESQPARNKELQHRAAAAAAAHRAAWEKEQGPIDHIASWSPPRPSPGTHHFPDELARTLLGEDTFLPAGWSPGWEGVQQRMHWLMNVQRERPENFRALREWIEAWPKSLCESEPASLVFRASAAYVCGDYQAAAVDFGAVLRRQRDEEACWLGLAFCFRQMGLQAAADKLLFDLPVVINHARSLDTALFADPVQLAYWIEK